MGEMYCKCNHYIIVQLIFFVCEGGSRIIVIRIINGLVVHTNTNYSLDPVDLLVYGHVQQRKQAVHGVFPYLEINRKLLFSYFSLIKIYPCHTLQMLGQSAGP